MRKPTPIRVKAKPKETNNPPTDLDTILDTIKEYIENHSFQVPIAIKSSSSVLARYIKPDIESLDAFAAANGYRLHMDIDYVVPFKERIITQQETKMMLKFCEPTIICIDDKILEISIHPVVWRSIPLRFLQNRREGETLFVKLPATLIHMGRTCELMLDIGFHLEQRIITGEPIEVVVDAALRQGKRDAQMFYGDD